MSTVTGDRASPFSKGAFAAASVAGVTENVWLANDLVISSFFYLSVQPCSQSEQQLVCIDRLRHVFRCACLETLLTITLHRLRRKSDDRQPTKLYVLSNDLHRLVAIHL